MRKQGRRDFLRTVAVFAGAAGTAAFFCEILTAGEEAEMKNPPNILFIMSDDHSYRTLSCYGSNINKTPHLDRIAHEGMRFNHCCVSTSLCSPSRAAFLTGKYGHINGQVVIGKLFDGSQPTFPKMLQAAGYATAVVGKWHLNSEPTGFDYWSILIGQGKYFDPELVENGKSRNYKGYTTDIITDVSLEWLKNRPKDKPFCLLTHHKAPHNMWEPDEKHADMYKDVTIPEPDNFNDMHEGRISPKEGYAEIADMHVHYRRKKGWRDVPQLSSPQEQKEYNYQKFIKDYLRVVASVDDNVGRMLDYLDKENLTENTIVIYTTDNGFFAGEHGWQDKKFIYEESLHLPFLVRYPEEVKPGTVCDDFVVNVDFAPTLLDYAGIPVPDDIQGRSFRSLLEGRTPSDWRTAVYYQWYKGDRHQQRLPHYGIRTRRYKLVHFFSQIDDWELYDLKNDPGEMKNVYSDPAYKDTIEQLKKQLAGLRKELKIDRETEMDIIRENRSGNWNRELRQYNSRFRTKWREGAATSSDGKREK